MADENLTRFSLKEFSKMMTDIQVKRSKQAIFAYEAFQFLLNNAHLWIEYPKDILFRLTIIHDCDLFTTNIKNAVIAQTYLSRARYRKLALEKFEEIKAVQGFERIITKYSVYEDPYYFYNFLDWISFLFYFTMFCYKQGYDYIEAGHRCLAMYPNVNFFHSVGGWAGFDNMSVTISEIINTMTTACLIQNPSDTKFLMFDKSVKKLERRHRYESNKWTQINVGVLQAKYVIQETSAKFRAVSSLDPRRVIPGYKFIIPDESYFEWPELEVVLQNAERATSSQQITERGNETGISDMMGVYKTQISSAEYEAPFCASKKNAVEYAENEYISEDREKAPSILTGFRDKIGMPTEFADGVDGKKCAFVISERYLRKKNAVKNTLSKAKRGIKICSHSQNSDKFVRNLQEILDVNITRRNYRKIDENTLVVCSPDCNYESGDTQIVVLDTSTEEEDDDFDTADQDIPFNIDYFNRQNTDFNLSHSSENAQYSLESSTGISTDVQFVPTKSTGAIPKVQTSVKKKSERRSKPIKCPQLENLQTDLEKFNPSTFQSETESISRRSEDQLKEESIYDRTVQIVENVIADLLLNSLSIYPDDSR